MYKTFFQLQRDPFEISPDPHFIYPTTRHNEALANLYYAILARKGFVVITGEVGTGKTLLVRCLLEELEKHRVRCAYVFNPLLKPLEFLRYLTSDLGLAGEGNEKNDLLKTLYVSLLRSHSQGYSTVLVVDEAHLLCHEMLEEIRLLSNLETTKGKLLQIALVGQPELDEKLDAPGLRQLKQRIALRYSLRPLNWEDTRNYVQWRLDRAGASPNPPIFPEETLRAVFQYSRGVPRLINTICENALVSAYAASMRSVSVQVVKEVCADLRLDAEPQLSCKEGFSFELGEELAIKKVFQDWEQRPHLATAASPILRDKQGNERHKEGWDKKVSEDLHVVPDAHLSSRKDFAIEIKEELVINKLFRNWERRRALQ